MRFSSLAKCVFDDDALCEVLDGLHQQMPTGRLAVVFLRLGATRHPAGYWAGEGSGDQTGGDGGRPIEIVMDNLEGIEALVEGIVYPRAIAGPAAAKERHLPTSKTGQSDTRTLRRDAYDLVPLRVGPTYVVALFAGYGSSADETSIAGFRVKLQELGPNLAGVMSGRVEWIVRRQNDIMELVASIDTPLIICNEALEFIGMNQAARDFVHGPPGEAALSGPPTTLVELGAEELAHEIAGAPATGPVRIVSTMPDGAGGIVSVSARRHLMAQSPMLAIQERLELSELPAWVVSFSDRQQAAHLFGQAVIEKHGFSRAEARLLRGLLSGHNLTEFAAENRLSYNTVRNQLASIYQKTGINRQADLIRKFSGMH